jgi:hypothetical protein
MKDNEINLKDLLNMQQAQLNVLMSVCGALIAQRLDWKNILEGLAKYNDHVASQDKPAAYVTGVASVVQALCSSVEIFRTTQRPTELYPSPPPGTLH